MSLPITKQKRIIAKFILLCSEEGIELDSPYAIENLCEDVLCVHDHTPKFFWKQGKVLDPVNEAKKFLGSA